MPDLNADKSTLTFCFEAFTVLVKYVLPVMSIKDRTVFSVISFVLTVKFVLAGFG